MTLIQVISLFINTLKQLSVFDFYHIELHRCDVVSRTLRCRIEELSKKSKFSEQH